MKTKSGAKKRFKLTDRKIKKKCYENILTKKETKQKKFD